MGLVYIYGGLGQSLHHAVSLTRDTSLTNLFRMQRNKKKRKEIFVIYFITHV